jgi:quinol monooxygenase YgiN
MIHVIATIELKPDCRGDYLKILSENVPKVRAEDGCLAYEPTIDIESGLPIKSEIRDQVVTIVEAWVTLEALHAHLKAEHMTTYREAVQDYVAGLSVRVLKPV